jgi:excisionase family DNA binding protein
MARQQQIAEAGRLEVEAGAQPLNLRHASPYLTTREAVVYLRLGSLSALYRHIKENRLPSVRRGRTRLFDVRDLDAWLRQELHLIPSRRSRA